MVDPQRDVSGYLADAEAHGLTIEPVLETHFHADFLSGHLELAEATGAADRLRRRGHAPTSRSTGSADGQRLVAG